MRKTVLWCALLALAPAALSLAACQTAPSGATPSEPGVINLRLRGKAQRRNLSCESRSACDVLAHYGIEVTGERFFQRLPKSDNPDVGFVGDVNGPTGQLPPKGYGVHEEPIATTMSALGLAATPTRDASLRWLHGHLQARRPVIVWATSTLRPGKAVALRDRDGRSFAAVRGEHTYVASGWDPRTRKITLVDSATGRARTVALAHFDAAWASLGRRAVAPVEAPR